MLEEILSGNFSDDVRTVDECLRVTESFDIIKRVLKVSNTDMVMYYIDGFVKQEMTQKILMNLSSGEKIGKRNRHTAVEFAAECLPTVEVDIVDSVRKIVVSVLSGCTAFLCDGFGASAIIIDTRTYPARNTQEPENDKVMRGSRDGFVETLILNTALIRRRIRNPALTVRYFSIGSESQTDVAMCYIDGKADSDFINTLTEKLDHLNIKSLNFGHQSLAESLIREKWYNPFPKIRYTERPDAASASILEGSIIILCDNSPEAMILPTSIFDFLQETDDYYFPPLTGTYLRLLRQLIFVFTIILTPLWYLLLMNPGVLPPQLSFVIPKSPGSIPILLQLYLTEFAIDGLKLASLNTPTVLSNSLSVVGGLLLGDFAVTVGWLSPDVILYMAFVAIANFTQSSYDLGYAFKYMRMLILTLTALFNIWGFVSGIVLSLVLVLTNKTVNGKRSYLYPLIPFNGHALTRLVFRLKKKE